MLSEWAAKVFSLFICEQWLKTCLTNLVRRGNDLVLMAEVADHKRLETIRRYSLPSLEDRESAMEGLRIELC